jgi:ABC-type transport system involved in multi-copper enzyme maturation permease subunit
VLWREVRQVTFGSRRRFLIIALLAAAGLVFLYVEYGMRDEGVNNSLAILGALAIMVQSVFMTTGSIAGEREARTWEVLLTTPLRGRSILVGKAAGALRSQWFLPTAVLAHFVVVALAGLIAPILAVQLAMIYLGPALFFTATGVVFSLVFRKGVVAAACNLGVALLLWVGSWIGVGLLGWFNELSDRAWFDYALDACYCVNPITMSTSATDTGIRIAHGFRVLGTYTIHGTQDRTLSGLSFMFVLAAVLAFYAVAGAVVMVLGLAFFRRLSGRSS